MSTSARLRRGMWLFLMLVLWAGTVQAAVIDYPPPAFPVPPSPWKPLADQSVITYAFKTSWDGNGWTEEEKTAVRSAITLVDNVLPDQTFVESADFTVRWAGGDFFKDWRTKDPNGIVIPPCDNPGWDLSSVLAVAYKHNNGPWDPNKFPNNEIYVNQGYPWSSDPNGPVPGKYDLQTVLMHKVIHMLACDAHATDPDEVMYSEIGMGERRELKQSDLNILLNAGYTVIPEPATLSLLAMGCLAMVRRRRT